MNLKRKLLLFCFPLFGVLLTAYSPMASYSMAQSSIDAQLQAMKQKATDELNRRIANYQKTLDNMKDVPLSANGGAGSMDSSAAGTVTCTQNNPASPSTAASPSASPAASLGNLGIKVVVALPCGIKDKAKTAMQKIIDELKTIKDKVANVKTLDDMQKLAQNIDTQFNIDQVTQVQAESMQSVSSMSGVLDGIKTTFSDIQSRVTALKDCLAGNGASSTASPSASPSADKCANLDKDNAKGAVDQAQGQLDGLSTIISTIASIVMSAITLIITLLTSFIGILGGLGSSGGGGLGNLSSLGSMLGGGAGGGLGGLTGLAGSAGGLGGLMSSFTGILSQLNIGQSMAGGAAGGLGNLSGLLGGLNLPF